MTDGMARIEATDREALAEFLGRAKTCGVQLEVFESRLVVIVRRVSTRAESRLNEIAESSGCKISVW